MEPYYQRDQAHFSALDAELARDAEIERTVTEMRHGDLSDAHEVLAAPFEAGREGMADRLALEALTLLQTKPGSQAEQMVACALRRVLEEALDAAARDRVDAS